MKRALVIAFAVTFAGHARAQASSLGRALYDEGLELQQRGDCDAALERYAKSLATEWAEATVLRTAECRVAMGQLVEAAAILRALATSAASALLADLEPRVPTVLVQVDPPSATGLTVTIDGEPVSRTRLAAPIEMNPGEHTIAARGDDYDPRERKVNLAERQHAAITLGLVRGSSTSGNAPTGTGSLDPASAAIVGGMLLAGTAIAAARPSFLVDFGAGAAFAVPIDGPVLEALGVGGMLALEVGARVAKYFIPRVHVDGGPFVHGSMVAYNVGLAFMTSPDGFGLFVEGAFGGRNVFPGTGPPSATGIEGLVGLGVHRAVGALQIVPRVDTFVGTFGGGEIHAFVTIGVMVYWERPVGRPPPR